MDVHFEEKTSNLDLSDHSILAIQGPVKRNTGRENVYCRSSGGYDPGFERKSKKAIEV